MADAPASAPAAIEASSEPSVIGGNLTAWSIAREQYNSSSTVYIFPNGKRQSGDQIQDWARIPSGTKVVLNEVEDNQPFEGFLEIGKDGDTPQAVAGAAYAKSTSIYFFPDGMIRTGAELKKRRSTQKLLTQAPKGPHPGRLCVWRYVKTQAGRPRPLQARNGTIPPPTIVLRTAGC